jgi:hypothetical protein
MACEGLWVGPIDTWKGPGAPACKGPLTCASVALQLPASSAGATHRWVRHIGQLEEIEGS